MTKVQELEINLTQNLLDLARRSPKDLLPLTNEIMAETHELIRILNTAIKTYPLTKKISEIKQPVKKQETLKDLVLSMIEWHPVLKRFMENGRSIRKQATETVLKTVEDKTLTGSTPVPSANHHIGRCTTCFKLYKIPLDLYNAMKKKTVRLQCKKDHGNIVVISDGGSSNR